MPLGEAYEAYRVRIRKDGVVRREDTVSAPTWNYDAAAQLSDGVSAPYSVEISQISDLFGPGSEARMIVNA